MRFFDKMRGRFTADTEQDTTTEEGATEETTEESVENIETREDLADATEEVAEEIEAMPNGEASATELRQLASRLRTSERFGVALARLSSFSSELLNDVNIRADTREVYDKLQSLVSAGYQIKRMNQDDAAPTRPLGSAPPPLRPAPGVYSPTSRLTAQTASADAIAAEVRANLRKSGLPTAAGIPSTLIQQPVIPSAPAPTRKQPAIPTEKAQRTGASHTLLAEINEVRRNIGAEPLTAEEFSARQADKSRDARPVARRNPMRWWAEGNQKSEAAQTANMLTAEETRAEVRRNTQHLAKHPPRQQGW